MIEILSMKRFCILSLFSAVAFSATLALAAAPLVNTACSQPGKTKMDTDGKNIIACVCSSVANCAPSDLIWKAMTNDVLTTGTISCPEGHVMIGISNGQPQCN